jgi:hypothetical protein
MKIGVIISGSEVLSRLYQRTSKMVIQRQWIGIRRRARRTDLHVTPALEGGAG